MIDNNIIKYLSSNIDYNELDLREHLTRLENARVIANSSSYNGVNHLKNMYYRKYLVDVDELVSQDTNGSFRNIDYIISSQKNSLDMWLDYLLSDEVIYPEWFKFFIFQGIVKFGEYDERKGVYKKRNSMTVDPFIKIDYEVIAFIYDNLVNYFEGKKLDDEELEEIIKKGNFENLYNYCVKMVEFNSIVSLDDKIKVRRINKGITELNNELEDLEDKLNKVPYGDMETYRKLYSKMYEVKGELYRLEEKKNSIVSLVKYNDEIELRRSKHNKYSYEIFLRNINEYIGEINYRKFHVQGYLGDIGYRICGEFRGHGYAYQALELLSEKLYEDHIPSFLITTYKDNLPSKKIIEKYGGKLVSKEIHMDKDVLVYNCETRMRKNNIKVK